MPDVSHKFINCILSVTEIKALQDQLVMERLSILGFYLQLRFHVGAFQDRNVVKSLLEVPEVFVRREYFQIRLEGGNLC